MSTKAILFFFGSSEVNSTNHVRASQSTRAESHNSLVWYILIRNKPLYLLSDDVFSTAVLIEGNETRKQILYIEQKLVKNPSRWEADQLASYKTQIHLVSGKRIWTRELRISHKSRALNHYTTLPRQFARVVSENCFTVIEKPGNFFSSGGWQPCSGTMPVWCKDV